VSAVASCESSRREGRPPRLLYKLSGIVESGVTVVITKPMLNLAFFDQ